MIKALLLSTFILATSVAISYSKYDSYTYTSDLVTLDISNNFHFSYNFIALYLKDQRKWQETLAGNCFFKNLDTSNWKDGDLL